MRWDLAVIYALLLLAGFSVIVGRLPPDPRAGTSSLRTELPVSDASSSAQGPRYAKRDIKTGEVIKADDALLFPELKWKEGVVPVAVAVDGKLVQSGDVRVGAMVRMCKDKAAALEAAVPLAAVICSPGLSACVAIAAVPANQALELSKAFATPPVPTLRPVKAPAASDRPPAKAKEGEQPRTNEKGAGDRPATPASSSPTADRDAPCQ
jgi:hypothetical protein